MTTVVFPQPDDPIEDQVRFWRAWARQKDDELPVGCEGLPAQARKELERLLGLPEAAALRRPHCRGGGDD